MYVARFEYYGLVYDSDEKFLDSRSCVEFIYSSERFIILNWLACRMDFNTDHFNFVDKSYVRVYDLSQHRYCDSFDF